MQPTVSGAPYVSNTDMWSDEDEHNDYMDMTPKSSPFIQRNNSGSVKKSNSISRSNSPAQIPPQSVRHDNRGKPSQNHANHYPSTNYRESRYDNQDYVELAPLIGTKTSVNMKSSMKIPLTQEGVYADMTRSSPLRTSLRKENNLTLHARHHSSPIKANHDIKAFSSPYSQISMKKQLSEESSHANGSAIFASNNQKTRDANSFSRLRKGSSHHSEDDDDYEDINSMPNKNAKKHSSRSKNTPHQSTMSPMRSPLQKLPTLPARLELKNAEKNVLLGQRNNLPSPSEENIFVSLGEFRKRSGGMSMHSPEDVYSLPVDVIEKSPTKAGLAAKKYLNATPESFNDNHTPSVRSSPTSGIIRSSSRVGKQGGAQSRILRNRQQQSVKELSHLSPPTSPQASPFYMPEENSHHLVRASSVGAIGSPESVTAMQRSRTLDKNVKKLDDMRLIEKDLHKQRDSNRMSFEKRVGKGSDGSNYMKYIANQQRSHSLDKKYVEWLAKTSPYASRHSSSTLDDGSLESDNALKSDGKDNKQFEISTEKKSPKNNSKTNLREELIEDSPDQSPKKNKKGKIRRVKTMVLKSNKKLNKSSTEIEIEKPLQKQKSNDGVSPEKIQKKDPDERNLQIDNSKKTKKSRISLKFSSGKKKKTKSKKTETHSVPDILQAVSPIAGRKLSLVDNPNFLGKPPTGFTIKRNSYSSPNIAALANEPDVAGEKIGKNDIQSTEVYGFSEQQTSCDTSCITIGSDTKNMKSDSDSTSETTSDDTDCTEESFFQSSFSKLNISAKGKSSTIGRLFIRKSKTGKDGIDPPGKLFKRGGSDDQILLDDDISCARHEFISSSRYFMQESNMRHGLVIGSVENVATKEKADLDFVNVAKKMFRPSGVNKYATITGLYRRQDSNEKRSLFKIFPQADLITDDKSELKNPNQKTTHKRSRSNVPVPYQKSQSQGYIYEQKNLPGRTSVDDDRLSIKSFNQIKTTPIRQHVRQKFQPLCKEPSPRVMAVARVLYQYIQHTQPDILRNQKTQDEKATEGCEDDYITDEAIYENCAIGHELITWLQDRSQRKPSIIGEKRDATFDKSTEQPRGYVAGMWQVLLEEGAISHVRNEEQFEDGNYFYCFHKDVTTEDEIVPEFVVFSPKILISAKSSVDSDMVQFSNTDSNCEDVSLTSRSSSLASNAKITLPSSAAECDMSEAILFLEKNAPDALFRMALRKLPENRSPDELLMIYEEILHIKALSHLSDSVKRELAAVLQFEYHHKTGTTLFSQGDEGRSWYIILRGSVNVSILGKGVVCTLREGDDFGDLALINEAPRAASIVLAENDCQFLKVEKFDFVRILKDVEANTVRLKEHGEDVLVLQKIMTPASSGQNQKNGIINRLRHDHPSTQTLTRQLFRYSILAGTPEKILEHILEYLKPWDVGRKEDSMEDFILMHVVFMQSDRLCELLLKHYNSEDTDVDFERSIKRKVVYFVVRWSHISSYFFAEDEVIQDFVTDLRQDIHFDSLENPTYDQLKMEIDNLRKVDEICSPNKCLLNISDSFKIYQNNGKSNYFRPVRDRDEVLMKIHNLEKTYTTVKLSVKSTVDEILSAVAEKISKPKSGLTLMELQEDGDSYPLARHRNSIATSAKLNSRLYVCNENDLSRLSKVERWIQPMTETHLEMVSSLEIAYQMTHYDWELLNNVHVMEFIYKVFGAHKFQKVTPNLDLLSRHFNQLAYWAPTEICSCQNLNKRVQLLRKFIKIAQHLKMYQNLNAFMAVMIGIGNQAVSRLYNTWDKLPAKYKKQVQEFESILNPSRNHRSYRLIMSSTKPPNIPYLPLLLKDMTFLHEGNDTKKSNLINFEKLHMLCNCIRSVVRGCGTGFDVDSILSSIKTANETRHYVRNMQVITDQIILNEMSNKLEPKR
ncbi:unnamed protein product [Clavelina lepadiformis]|uniref:Rap guanine nucleotide exchange factor 4 n=1 Tax=Clavelina lepadiformis TaxID=159417 RepID=A0ABP0GXC8_CLALP